MRKVRIGRPLLVLLILCAFLLRFGALPGRSMWLDEGTTLLRIWGTWQQNFANITMFRGWATIDTHPQVYFVLVKAWTGLAGDSEFSLKAYSALWSVLAAPLGYVLARRLANMRAALLAVFLIVIAPGLQWYAQEVRPYAMIPAIAAFTTYALLRAKSALKWRVIWVAAVSAACLTHYSFAGFALAQGLIFAGLFDVRRMLQNAKTDWRWPLIGMLAIILAAALVYRAADIPALFARLRSGAESDFHFVPLHTILASVVLQTMLGLNVDAPGDWFALPLAVAAVFAMLSGSLRGTGAARWRMRVMAMTTALTVLVWFGISFVKPNFQNIRHVYVAVMPVLVLSACGLTVLLAQRARVLRLLGSALTFLTVAVMGYGMVYTFVPTPSWQDDWRGMAAYIKSRWQPDDQIWQNFGVPEASLAMYLRGLPAFSTPMLMLPPYSDLTRDELLKRGGRIWLINMGGRDLGPGNEADAWLPVDKVTILERIVFRGRTNTPELMLIDLKSPYIATLPTHAQVVDNPYVAGMALEAGGPYANKPNFTLALYWRHAARVAVNGISLRASRDDAPLVVFNGEPGFDRFKSWTPDRFLVTRHHVNVPVGLGEQEIMLTLDVLGGEKRETLSSISRRAMPREIACCLSFKRWQSGYGASDQAQMPRLPPLLPPSAIGIPEHWLRPDPLRETEPVHRLTDVDLIDVLAPASMRPGEALPIALTWRRSGLATPWESELAIIDLLGREIGAVRRPTGPTDSNTSTWQPGAAVRDVYVVSAPYSARPGWYRLVLKRWRDSKPIDGALLGWIQIRAYDPSPVPGRIETPLDATVGELRLLGVNLPTVTRGGVFEFHTYWRVDAAPQRDGVLFLHLIKPNGEPGPQDDSPPEGGARSTLSYSPGDGIDQIHRIAIPADAPAGEYLVYAGIYDRDDIERWPATHNGAPAKDNLIPVGRFTLN